MQSISNEYIQNYILVIVSYQAFTSNTNYFSIIRPIYPQCALLLVVSTILAFMTSTSNHRLLWIMLQVFNTAFRITLQYRDDLIGTSQILIIIQVVQFYLGYCWIGKQFENRKYKFIMIPGYLLAGIGISFLGACINLDYYNKSADKMNNYEDAMNSLEGFSTWSQLIVIIMCVPLFFISDQVDKSLQHHYDAKSEVDSQ